MVNVCPVGRSCSQAERLQFAEIDAVSVEIQVPIILVNSHGHMFVKEFFGPVMVGNTDPSYSSLGLPHEGKGAKDGQWVAPTKRILQYVRICPLARMITAFFLYLLLFIFLRTASAATTVFLLLIMICKFTVD